MYKIQILHTTLLLLMNDNDEKHSYIYLYIYISISSYKKKDRGFSTKSYQSSPPRKATGGCVRVFVTL